MSHNNNRIGLVVMAAVVAALPHTARGSLAVQYAMVGCIKGNKFHMSGGVTPSLVGAPIKTLDGKTIRIEGYLSPGDSFQADALFIIDEVCREDLHQKYFLCDPCRTLPHDPPSRAVPRREKGVAVQVPREVIKQFDNLLYQLMRGIREE
jgi:hypothetical protein